MASTSKNHLAGGKYTGSHTTVIPTARIICEIANACSYVTKISLGFIKTGLRASGVQSVKIIEKGKYLLLAVKGNTSMQEIHVYVTDINKAKLSIASGAKDRNIGIRFPKEP